MANETAAFVEKSTDTISNFASEAQERASRALHDASETLHDAANCLPRGQSFAHSAANQLDSAAGYIAEHDTSEMLADAGSILSRHPGKTLVLGMVLGCMVGWILRRK